MKTQKTYLAIKEFKDTLKELKKKNGSFHEPKDCNGSLTTLRQNGYGNCVAMSKLFRKICKKRKISNIYHVMLENICVNEIRHQGTLIYNSRSKLFWYQSNEDVFKMSQNDYLSFLQIEEMRLIWTEPKKVVLSEYWPI